MMVIMALATTMTTTPVLMRLQAGQPQAGVATVAGRVRG